MSKEEPINIDLGDIPCNDIFAINHPGITIEYKEIMDLLKNIRNKTCPINIIKFRDGNKIIYDKYIKFENNIKNIKIINTINITLLSLLNILLLIIIFKIIIFKKLNYNL